MSILNSRKRHQIDQQIKRGQTAMQQVRAVGNAPLIALGSNEKRPWADVGFMRLLRKYRRHQTAMDADDRTILEKANAIAAAPMIDMDKVRTYMDGDTGEGAADIEAKSQDLSNLPGDDT